ncbi:MAG: serine/threonine protein kinase [Oscillatoria princeps RMCB-10]|jgi:WD40 repeat protein|nr:serine/threonine protein kinase [Oscillatoria princeps RMCB-10]
MICCLNPECQNPQHPNGTKVCQSCGTQLGKLRNRYRPIKPIGGGGFAKTYLAEDADKLNELCAIKQLAPSFQGSWQLEKAKELFEQEAQRLQQLGTHSQIPSLLAYFEEDSRLYLVQQYIEGQTLKTELENFGPFSEQKIWELLLDLLPVLEYIHRHGVIHRDIKPENIIRRTPQLPHPPTPLKKGLAPAAAGGTAELAGELVLLDFGVAKQQAALAVGAPGTTIGTPGYAPAEQMERGEASAAGDLYSLGATCFHLLSATHPLELKNRHGYGWVYLWREHLRGAVSQELGRILDKLLQQDCRWRYQSAEEVLQDLHSRPRRPAGMPLFPHPLPWPPAKLWKILLPAGAAILLLGAEICGSFRYGVFPFNPIFLIIGQPSRIFLKATLSGHTEPVLSLAISPDGQTLASGSVDSTIKLWYNYAGKERATLTGHTDWVRSVAISPDGLLVVSGSLDNTIKIWDLATGKQKTTLKGHTGSVWSVAISPDGETVASGSNDRTVKIWDTATGTLKNTLTGNTNSVNAVAISRDGKTLVSGSNDKTVKVWDLATGKEKTALLGHTGEVKSVAISPDGQIAVSGSNDTTIKVWDLAAGTLKTTLKGHAGAVFEVAVSPDGRTLVSGSLDKTVKVWDLATGTEKFTLLGHTNSVNSVAISPDGQTIFSGSRDSTIKIWRMPK